MKNAKNNNAGTVLPEKRWSHTEALKIASALLEELRPYCVKAEIAGSIRRKCKDSGDIELVIQPKEYSVGLFSTGIASVINKYQKIKGELPCKYTCRLLPEGIKVDIFICEPGNFGLNFAVRSGDSSFSHEILAKGWVRNGYHSKDAYLWRDGQRYECPEEIDLFKRAGVKWVHPEQRNLNSK